MASVAPQRRARHAVVSTARLPGSRAYIENSEREVPPYDPNATVVCMDSWPTEKILHVIVLGLSELTATVILCVTLSAGTFISMRVIGKHLTAYTRKLNVQLTSLLILQFTVQLLLIATPLFGIMVQRVVFKNEGPKPFLGVLYVFAFCLYGYANAVLTLLFVAPYRMRIVAHCSRIAEAAGIKRRRLVAKQVTVASTSVVSTGAAVNRRLPHR
ncbi:hypothetical protein AAVH_27645 [Aphelenchoides avenae]|nr:hypothetical protein AAVH_27645 [Aphelenchus avenae]